GTSRSGAGCPPVISHCRITLNAWNAGSGRPWRFASNTPMTLRASQMKPDSSTTSRQGAAGGAPPTADTPPATPTPPPGAEAGTSPVALRRGVAGLHAEPGLDQHRRLAGVRGEDLDGERLQLL